MIFLTKIKTDKILKALEKKGFKKDSKRDHIILRFYMDNKKTAIFTKISHGKSEYGDPLLNYMKKELHISKPELINLINCVLSEEMYIEYLKQKGFFS